MGKTVSVDYVKGQKLDVYKDKKALDEMTEEELHEAALEDPDAQPLSEEQLKRFKRVNPNLPKKEAGNG
ncbi:hypothetical protein [Endozoicomonas sp. 8E]|uniref:hypothetical protein n=1 Tax=unclassified Endozoicomonas TaxID=2644528 RepID=UPI002939529A|nr:hypothetical protein [Endozoicomonas sp. 8E]WOG28298.1 hypothetical protein P6910_01210 [Endozoicomonas sp. 8E]